MPVQRDTLTRFLDEFNAKHNCQLSAVIARSGMPMAWSTNATVAMDVFSSLSATIVGAAEVIYSDLNKEPPSRILIVSPNGILIATGLGKKAVFVVVAPGMDDSLLKGIEVLAASVREVLTAET